MQTCRRIREQRWGGIVDAPPHPLLQPKLKRTHSLTRLCNRRRQVNIKSKGHHVTVCQLKSAVFRPAGLFGRPVATAFIGLDQSPRHPHVPSAPLPPRRSPLMGMASGLINPTFNQHNQDNTYGAAITPYHSLSEKHFYLSPDIVTVLLVE